LLEMSAPGASICVVAGLVLLACGEEGAGGGAQGGGPSGGGGTGGASGCDDPASCVYPSRDLEVTVRQGFSIQEPITGRTLQLLARVPDLPGPVPLVIWSHGGGFLDAGHEQSATWGDTLASHGYAVLHVAHSTLTLEAGLALCDLASIAPADCAPPGDDEDATGLLALAKTTDVIAVLDQLPTLSDGSVAQGGPAIDLNRVVVAGWSAGARAPMVTMGATFAALPGEPPLSFADSRVVAAIGLSPAGPGFGGFVDDSWSSSRGPILFITGDNDQKPTKPDLSGAVRRQAFENQPQDGQRWLLYSNLVVGVGGHTTYNLEDLGSSDERLVALTEAARSTARAFLDAVVLDDPNAQRWLASDAPRIVAGEAEWLNR
jgi:hypothetical protein